MPPLDDELRSVLRARAETVPLLPDPLPGVAQRARTLRRRRAAAAVAGSALAVLGVVGGAALLLPGAKVVSRGPVATSPSPEAPVPSATATPPEARSPYALDPASPWPYRSSGAPLPEQEQQAYLRAWSETHPGDDRPPALLFSQRWEPSGLQEVLVLGSSSFGLLRESEAGPDLVSEAPLPAEPLALVTVLDGDEGVPRVLTVASPEVDVLSLRSEREADAVVAPLAELAPGVGTGALEPGDARRRVLTGVVDDRPVFAVDVPDAPSRPS